MDDYNLIKFWKPMHPSNHHREESQTNRTTLPHDVMNHLPKNTIGINFGYMYK
jgi:hypothetical protein